MILLIALDGYECLYNTQNSTFCQLSYILLATLYCINKVSHFVYIKCTQCPHYFRDFHIYEMHFILEESNASIHVESNDHIQARTPTVAI